MLYSNSSNNSSPELQEVACFVAEPLAVRVLRIVPYALIIPVSLLGNLLVIHIVHKDKGMRKTINYFIVNTSIADLVITVMYMPRVITILAYGYKWLISGLVAEILCKSVAFLYESAVIVSILTMVVISLDRLFAVVWPLQNIISKTKCKVIMVVIWCVAMASRSPIPYAIKLIAIEQDHLCYVDFDASFYVGADLLFYKVTLIVFYATPLTTIVITYTAIIVTLQRRKIPGNDVRTESQAARVDQLNRQVLRMVLVVVGGFVLCWLLYFITMILIVEGIIIPCNVFYLRLVLAHCNCAINPCLYVTLSENYRKGFKRAVRRLKRACHCCKESRQDDITTGQGLNNLYMMELTLTNGSTDHLAYTLHIND